MPDAVLHVLGIRTRQYAKGSTQAWSTFDACSVMQERFHVELKNSSPLQCGGGTWAALSLLHGDMSSRLAGRQRLEAHSRLICTQGGHASALRRQRGLYGPDDQPVHCVRQTDGRDFDKRVADAQKHVLLALQGCLRQGGRF